MVKSNGKNSGKRGRQENLKSWKKGQSGNPKGRKKFVHIRDRIKERFEQGEDDIDAIIQDIKADGFGKSKTDASVKNVARRLYLSYAFGEPQRSVDVTSNGETIDSVNYAKLAFQQIKADKSTRDS